MLATMWLIIKVLAGSILIIFLAGILILLLQSLLDAIFEDKK